jgi:hypothetical protein
MFSDLDGKPRFKEAFIKIRFATSSLAWNFNKKAYPDPSGSVYLPNLTLFSPVFSSLDSFYVFYLDALGLLSKIEVTCLID